MASTISKNPKFVLSLGIPELTNIPSPSGSCYVKWSIKERSITSIKGKTKAANIRDYRVVWGYSTQVLLKLGTKSKDKVLKDKILVLSVYQAPHHHHHHNSTPHSQRSVPSFDTKSRPPHLVSDLNQLHQEISSHSDNAKTRLGKVEINLAEFINFEEPKRNRYLLKDSKINAVLHVEIEMDAVEGENQDYNAPPIKYKGLSNIFNSDSSSFPESATPMSSHHGGSHLKNASHLSANNRLYKNLAIINDPVVSKLYENTFDISWDYRPGENNVVECIEDIFNDGDGWAKNEDGVCLIDLQRKRIQDEVEKKIEAFGTKFGGANEFAIRGDMKGWQVCHT